MTRRSVLSLARSAALPAIALFIIADFAGFAIFGSNGWLQLAGYKAQRQDKLAELATVRQRHDMLARHSALLDPRHVDPDYAEELVRRETLQVRPDEAVLPAD